MTGPGLMRLKIQDVMESYEDDEPEDMQEMFALTLVLHMVACLAKQDPGDSKDDVINVRLNEI